MRGAGFYVRVIAPMLFLAAIIETFVTPVILFKLLLKQAARTKPVLLTIHTNLIAHILRVKVSFSIRSQVTISAHDHLASCMLSLIIGGILIFR